MHVQDVPLTTTKGVRLDNLTETSRQRGRVSETRVEAAAVRMGRVISQKFRP